jgi:hypothetical protein
MEDIFGIVAHRLKRSFQGAKILSAFHDGQYTCKVACQYDHRTVNFLILHHQPRIVYLVVATDS